MRENETRIGGTQWGLFSIFEPAEPRPNRTIDQSVVAWRLASRAAGKSAFENPRSTIQRTVNMITGGSNREHHLQLQDSIQPLRSANERVRFNPYFHGVPPPYNPEELARVVVHRRPMMTAGEVRMRMIEESRRPGFRYPTAAEVEEIQRRFRNPELEHAMEVARQEIMRRYWPRNVLIDPEPREYFAHMTRLISEPAPPGFREAMRAAAGDITEEENLR